MPVSLNIVDAKKRPHRECGQCTACCTTCSISELDKATNVTCVHVCARGCGIYETRPGSCRQFECGWLVGHLPEKYRPDRSGIVWGFEKVDDFAGTVAIAMLTRDDVPMDRIEFLYELLRKNIPGRMKLHIIPANLKLSPEKRIAGTEIKPGIFMSTGEAKS